MGVFYFFFLQDMALEASKRGYIEQLLSSKKKGKFLWFELYGSSLYAYETPAAVTQKHIYQLKGTTATMDKMAIVIKDGDKHIVSLNATSREECEEWHTHLSSASSLDACEAPTKEKKKKAKTSVGMRVTKNIGGKVASSGVGKAAVKGVVNEETRLLIVSLKKIIAKVESSKVANEIEENLIKIITKAFFLEKDKKITLDEFLEADDPLRSAFETLVEMRDYRHRMKPETVQLRFKFVHDKLVTVEKTISQMLVEHLKPKSMQRISRTFGLLGSAAFLDKAWGDPELEEERDLLTDAMNKYTQFHF